MNIWIPVLVAIVAGVAGLGGSLIGGWLNRPKTRADAVKLLTDAAVQQVNEMQEETARMRSEAVEARTEAADARRETREARAEVREIRRELTEVRNAFEELVDYTRQIIRRIHDPGVSHERLRETVPHELPAWPQRNGHRL